MASEATTPRPGPMTRVIHLLRPSCRQVAFFLVTEVSLAALGAPLWVHLVAACVVHVAVVVVEEQS